MDDKSSPTSVPKLINSLCVSSREIRNNISSILCKDFNVISVDNDLCGRGNTKITRKYLAENIVHLTNIIDSIDKSINPTSDSDVIDMTDFTNSNQFQSNINTQLTNSVALSQAVEEAMSRHTSDIQNQLKVLTDTLGKLNINVSTPDANINENCNISNHQTVNTTEHIDDYRAEFLSSDKAQSLKNFLDSSDLFIKNVESGHYAVQFGYPYRYTGSNTPTKPLDIPEPLQDLINEVCTTYNVRDINSCLVNKYDCGLNTFLPPHSDDEQTIKPGSSIFTVSLGSKVDITFTDMSSGKVVTNCIEPNSLYSMSRLSQSFWQHEIKPYNSNENSDVRYSITLRCISDKYLKSTVIIGDSNTYNLNFGEGEGTFGHNIPGARILAYNIDEIKPADCCGYRNIFIHTGINDVRQANITGPAKITACLNRLISKVEEIRTICPKAYIYVSPLLPTKDSALNRRCVYFNRLLFEYVNNSAGLVMTHNFGVFLDKSQQYLSTEMGRYQKPGDKLHLGKEGIRLLVKIIRECVYGRKSPKPAVSGTQKKYTEVVSKGTSHDRRS